MGADRMKRRKNFVPAGDKREEGKGKGTKKEGLKLVHSGVKRAMSRIRRCFIARRHMRQLGEYEYYKCKIISVKLYLE